MSDLLPCDEENLAIELGCDYDAMDIEWDSNVVWGASCAAYILDSDAAGEAVSSSHFSSPGCFGVAACGDTMFFSPTDVSPSGDTSPSFEQVLATLKWKKEAHICAVAG